MESGNFSPARLKDEQANGIVRASLLQFSKLVSYFQDVRVVFLFETNCIDFVV